MTKTNVQALQSGMQSLTESSTSGPSYHDVKVETQILEPTSIFDLPFGYELSCCRTTGWILSLRDRVVASEYPEEQCSGLRVTVNNFVIVDSLSKQKEHR